jgi:hypothetical protein
VVAGDGKDGGGSSLVSDVVALVVLEAEEKVYRVRRGSARLLARSESPGTVYCGGRRRTEKLRSTTARELARWSPLLQKSDKEGHQRMRYSKGKK